MNAGKLNVTWQVWDKAGLTLSLVFPHLCIAHSAFEGLSFPSCQKGNKLMMSPTDMSPHNLRRLSEMRNPGLDPPLPPTSSLICLASVLCSPHGSGRHVGSRLECFIQENLAWQLDSPGRDNCWASRALQDQLAFHSCTTRTHGPDLQWSKSTG